MRKVIGTALAVFLLVGALSAVAFAQEAESDATEDTTTEVERVSVLDQTLSDLVTEGVITQDQADTISERVGTLKMTFRQSRIRHLDTVAGVLGMDAADIQGALAGGSTLADIAGDQTDALIDALVAEHQARLDEAVAEGRIDADEAAEKAADIEQRVTDMVNGELELDRRGFGRRGHRHGGFGFGGAQTDDATAESTTT